MKRSRYVVCHKYGGLMGTFQTLAEAKAQNKAVHGWYDDHPKKNKLKKPKARRARRRK